MGKRGRRGGGTQPQWASFVQEEETDRGNFATRTRFTTKAEGGGTSTFTLEDNLVDSIIRDQERVRSRIAEFELQMQHVGELVGDLRGRVWLAQYKRPSKICAGCGIWSVRWTPLLRKIGRPRSKCGSWRRSERRSWSRWRIPPSRCKRWVIWWISQGMCGLRPRCSTRNWRMHATFPGRRWLPSSWIKEVRWTQLWKQWRPSLVAARSCFPPR